MRRPCAAVCGLLVIVSLVASGTASAYTNACPTAPASVTIGSGTGNALVLEVGWEVNQMRRDTAAACAALAERTAAIDTNTQLLSSINSQVVAINARLDTVNGNLSVSHNDSVVLHTDLGDVKTALAGLHADLTTAAPVSGTVDLGTATLASQDAAATQLDGDLWIIVGVICGLWAFGQVLRRVWP